MTAMEASAPRYLDLGDGISRIDSEYDRPGLAAFYLLVEGDQAAFIDSGTSHSVCHALEALRARQLAAEQVAYVIPTHVHLDHAGGVGEMMRRFPNARLVVHPRGARHMIDPGALLAGARAVYGDEEVARTYGEVQPVPPERVLQTSDGLSLDLAGRPLLFIDTPGHARHHHCVWDARSRGWFSGDTFGISYPECVTPRGRYLLPTTTPVQFEPEALKASVARLMAQDPSCMYLTHYGRVEGVAALAHQLIEQIDAMVALARQTASGPGRHALLEAGLAALYRERLRAEGSPLDDRRIGELLAMDIALNAQGLAVWLDRPAAAGT